MCGVPSVASRLLVDGRLHGVIDWGGLSVEAEW
jgi:hypothetical protein